MFLVIRLVPDNAAYIRGTLETVQAFFSKISASYEKNWRGPDFAGFAGPLRRQAGSHKGSRWLPEHSGHKKAPQVRG